MTLIDRGLDVNVHINHFYTWDPSTKSTYPNVFVELIRNGLSNFNTSSPLSLATIVIIESSTKAKRSTRRWSKVRFHFKLLHKLGSSFQMITHQFDPEKHILRLTKVQIMPETSRHPIIGSLKNIMPPRHHEAMTKAHN